MGGQRSKQSKAHLGDDDPEQYQGYKHPCDTPKSAPGITIQTTDVPMRMRPNGLEIGLVICACFYADRTQQARGECCRKFVPRYSADLIELLQNTLRV